MNEEGYMKQLEGLMNMGLIGQEEIEKMLKMLAFSKILILNCYFVAIKLLKSNNSMEMIPNHGSKSKIPRKLLII